MNFAKMRMRHGVSLMHTCLYVLLIPLCVQCFSTKQTLAKISVEYTDDAGNVQTHEFSDNTYYGKNSRVNEIAVNGKLAKAQRTVDHGNNTNEDGCGVVNPRLIPDCGPWIALIKRGNCTFNEKVYFTAKISKALAVIMYDDIETDYPFIMNTDGQHNVEDVVAVMTSYSHGRELVSILETCNSVKVTITKHRYSWRELFNLIKLHYQCHVESTTMTTPPNSSSTLPVMSTILLVFSLICNMMY